MGYRKGDMSGNIQDEIPFTNLNICHKSDPSQKRCFVYGYQVKINIKDSDRNDPFYYPMVEPKMYTRIQFNNINNLFKIEPGDRVTVNFGTGSALAKTVIQPNIYDRSLKEPFKSRY